MNHEATLRQLDELISSRTILNHPFYQAWEQGKLTRDQLSTYAKNYYPHVASFPGYLRAAIDAASDGSVRAELERNLADELSNPAPHNELWLNFAEGLGLDRQDTAARPATPATVQTVATFQRLMHGTSEGALTALYAYESQQPEVSRKKLEGLQKFYGVTSTKGLSYFEVHAEKDVEHREGERRALARCLRNGASPDAVLKSAQDALQAYWGLLDGICEEAGIHC